jgi:hypothetical protein
VLLAARGITDPARAHAFLKCDETCLHDPLPCPIWTRPSAGSAGPFRTASTWPYTGTTTWTA